MPNMRGYKLRQHVSYPSRGPLGHLHNSVNYVLPLHKYNGGPTCRGIHVTTPIVLKWERRLTHMSIIHVLPHTPFLIGVCCT
jgi:hypothetical protein